MADPMSSDALKIFLLQKANGDIHAQHNLERAIQRTLEDLYDDLLVQPNSRWPDAEPIITQKGRSILKQLTK